MTRFGNLATRLLCMNDTGLSRSFNSGSPDLAIGGIDYWDERCEKPTSYYRYPNSRSDGWSS